MNEMKAGLRLDLVGNITSRIKTAGVQMQDFFKNGNKGANLFSKSMSALGDGLDSLGNKYTAFLTGAGTTLAIKNVGDLNAHLTRVGINAGKSNVEMQKLINTIYRVSQQRNINIAPEELLSASSKVLEETGGNLEFVLNNLEKMAIAISATGASGESVGKMAASMFRNLDVSKAEDMINILGMLDNQGKVGGSSLKDFAEQSERIMVAYSRTGRKGIDAVADMNAMMQMARKTAADSSESAMAVEAMLKKMANPDFRKKLKGAGISLMDPQDPKRMRSMVDISKEIITKARGNREIIRRVFDDNSLNALNAMIDEYTDTKGFQSVDKILSVSRDGTSLMSDSARAAGEFNAALVSFKSAVSQFANTKLAEPLNRLAQALNKITPEQMQNYLDLAGKVIVGLGGLVIAKKGFNIARGIYGFFKDPVGSLMGRGLGGNTGAPVPVYVVNANALGGLTGKTSAGAGLLGIGKNLLKGVGIGLLVGTIVEEGKVLYSFWEKGITSTYDDIAQKFGETWTDYVNPAKLATLGGGTIGNWVGSLFDKGVEERLENAQKWNKQYQKDLDDKSRKITKTERDYAQEMFASKSENYIKLEVDTKTGRSSIKEVRSNDAPGTNTELDLSLGGASYAL